MNRECGGQGGAGGEEDEDRGELGEGGEEDEDREEGGEEEGRRGLRKGGGLGKGGEGEVGVIEYGEREVGDGGVGIGEGREEEGGERLGVGEGYGLIRPFQSGRFYVLKNYPKRCFWAMPEKGFPLLADPFSRAFHSLRYTVTVIYLIHVFTCVTVSENKMVLT